MKEAPDNFLFKHPKPLSSSEEVHKKLRLSEKYVQPRPLRDLYFDCGRVLLDRGRAKEAVKAYKQALMESDSSLASWKLHAFLARAYEQSSEKQQAFHAYLEAILSAPEYAQLLLPFAHNLLRRDIVIAEKEWLLQEWFPSFTDAFEVANTNRANTDAFAGRVYLHLGRYTDALRSFSQANQLMPNDIYILEGLGQSLWRTGELDSSEESLSRAYELAQQGRDRQRQVPITAKLAQVLAIKGKYDKALSLIEGASPDDSRFIYELFMTRSRCHLALGEPEKALQAAKEALQYRAGKSEPYLLCAQAFLALKQFNRALEATNNALQEDPSNSEALFFQAQALIEGEVDFEQARRLLQNYKEDVGDKEVLKQIHSAAFATGHLDPSWHMHYFLAQLFYTLGDYVKAVEELEDASRLLSGTQTRTQSAALQQHKGELLEKEHRLAELADRFYQAANEFYYEEKYNVAAVLFSQAAELRPDHALTYLYWSNALRYWAEKVELQEKEDQLYESINVWEQGYKVGFPEENRITAYMSCAQSLYSIAQVVTSQREKARSFWWEAVYYIERVLLLERYNEGLLPMLGYCYLALNKDAAAVRTLRQDQEDQATLLMLALMLIVCEDNSALEVINSLSEQSSSLNPLMGFFEAALLFLRGNLSEAVQVIDKAISEVDQPVDKSIEASSDSPSNDSLSYYFLRGRIRRLAGNNEEAETDFTYIWNITSPGKQFADPDHLSDRASAAYELGRYTEALDIFKGQPNSYSNWDSMGLCYLMLNQAEEADRCFKEALEALFHPSYEEIAMQGIFVRFSLHDLAEAEARLPETAKTRLSQRVIEDYRASLQKELQKAQAKVQNKEAAEQELLQVAEEQEGEAGSIPWLASRAGAARLALTYERWDAAMTIYQELLDQDAGLASPRLPEARLGLEKVADGLQEAGDSCLKEGDFQKALEHFSLTLTFVPIALHDDRLRQGNLYSRLGFTYFSLKDYVNACTYFAKAIESYRQNNIPDPAIAVGKECSPLLPDVAHYWGLEAEWKALVGDISIDEQVRSDLTTIWRSLTDYLNAFFKLSEQTAEGYGLIPVVTPIVIEIGEGLIPADTSTTNWALFKSYIPEMRERILTEMGVKLPGVRVRDNIALSPDEYNILLDESLHVLKGRVPLDMRYSPNSPEILQGPGIPKQALIEAAHPLTGAIGCWVSPDMYDLVASHQLELWEEPLVFVIYHLEAVLRRNLANFLGMQEFDELLDMWKQDEDDSARIASALPDTGTKLYLTRVLRALVQEQVPIKQWKGILDILQEPGLAHAANREIIQAVRLRLKQWLPGNNPKLQRLELPFGWEDGIASGLRHENGRTYFAAPAVETLRFLAMIRRHMPTSGGNAALVIRNAELRPFVQLLVESEFPYLMVLAEEEVLSPDELEVAQVEVNLAEVNAVEIREEGVITDAE